MSFIKTTSPHEAEGKVRDMYARQQEAWGYVPNYAKSFSARPELMEKWGRMLSEIRRPMDDRIFELATVAVALELKHTPCSLAHGSKLQPYYSNDEICSIATGRDLDKLPEADREIIRYARLIARDAAAIVESDVQRLRDAGLTDETIFDIAAAAAGRAFFTKILDAVGSLPDAGFSALDDDLMANLMVGKPLDTATDEVMK